MSLAWVRSDALRLRLLLARWTLSGTRGVGVNMSVGQQRREKRFERAD